MTYQVTLTSEEIENLISGCCAQIESSYRSDEEREQFERLITKLEKIYLRMDENP